MARPPLPLPTVYLCAAAALWPRPSRLLHSLQCICDAQRSGLHHRASSACCDGHGEGRDADIVRHLHVRPASLRCRYCPLGGIAIEIETNVDDLIRRTRRIRPSVSASATVRASVGPSGALELPHSATAAPSYCISASVVNVRPAQRTPQPKCCLPCGPYDFPTIRHKSGMKSSGPPVPTTAV